MKDETIKRSLEYSREKQKEYGWDSQAVQEGYLQGVLDATRWIPVEEKEPPQDEKILVKYLCGSVTRFEAVEVSTYYNGRFSGGCDWKYATHWRPIEF